MSAETPLCYVVTTLAPPTTGMTTISGRMVAALEARGHLDLWAVRKPEGQSSKLWFLYKNFGLMAGLARAAWRAKKTDTIYIVPDSNVGLWANLVLHLPFLWLSRAQIMFHHHVFRYVRTRDGRMATLCAGLKHRLSHILLCDGMRERFGALYPGDTRTLSNAVFLDLPEDTPPVSATCQSLGFLSNITEDKGILEFLALAEAAQAQWPDLQIHIGGGTGNAALAAKIETFIAAAPETRVWHGPVYGATKEQFFANIDALLFPTKYANEAQPVTIFEALARNRPVIATDQGCIASQLPAGACFAHADFKEGTLALLESWQDSAAFGTAVTTHSTNWKSALHTSKEQLDAVLAQFGVAK